MSIIERAVKLIAPLGSGESEPGGKVERDLIERVVDNRAAGSKGDETLRLAERFEPAKPDAVFDDTDSVVDVTNSIGETLLSESGARTSSVRDIRRSENPSAIIDLGRLREQGIITPDAARTSVSESFRMIKMLILMRLAASTETASSNLIMVTSARPGEGKTFCATNLAISMAMEKNRSVLLVDGDVANPSIPKVFGLDLDVGLMDVLGRGVDVERSLCTTNIGNLSLLPAGGEHLHSTELLASDEMGMLLKELSQRRDDRVIIFDSPPILAASEASVLSNWMGQIVVVVEAGKTPVPELEAALERVERDKVTGFVLNKWRSSRSRYGYEYGYGKR